MAINTMKLRIQLRRDHTANWALYKDIVPAAGEPCFDIDLGTLKIGNGVNSYAELKPIGECTVSADGKSIVLEDGVFKLAGFDAAEVGAYPRKTADGGIEWVVSTNEEVKTLQEAVEGLQTNVTNIQSTVNSLQEIVNPSAEGSVPLLDRIASLETKIDGEGEGSIDAKIDDKIEAFATTLTSDGKVNTLMELIDYVASHGDEVADMVTDIKSLQDLVGTTSVNDQILAAVMASEKKSEALYEKVKYEITNTPAGTLVDYRDKEIRVMVPADTKFEFQNSGTNADKNSYYIGFKAYAPDGAVNFKEDLAEIISDNTMHSFDGNAFAGVDKYGRKYSICWLAVAKYDEETKTWITYGSKSTKNKYLGFYYSVEWFDANGVCIGSDCIRINLSNEACHTNIEPYYMANVVKEIAVNGTLMDMVDGKVDIKVENIIKNSEEIVVNEDGSLGIGTISFDKIAQPVNSTLVLDGGSATTAE